MPRQNLLLSLALAASLAGCNRSQPAGAGLVAPAVEDHCDALVASVHDTFQLQRLGLTTAIGDGVVRLNDWRKSCRADAPAADLGLPPAAEKLLSHEQLEDLSDPRFNLRDGEHLRDCVLYRAVAAYAAGPDDPGRTDLDRVMSTFEHVIRSIGLVEGHPEGLPLTAYEVYLLGKGTAEDRAWIFANLLRQMKIDAVLVRPAEKRPAACLVAVLLDGQAYLFETRLGIPVPDAAPPDGSHSAAPATLEQAASDPQVLRQLDAGENRRYPLESADLAKPLAALVGDVSGWSARMHDLGSIFTGEQALTIADPLNDGPEGPGLWTRVARAGLGRWWTGEQITLWDYPESQLSAHADLSDAKRESLLKLLLPFEAYFNLVVDPRNGQTVAVAEEQFRDPAAAKFDVMERVVKRRTIGAQKKARLSHMGGDFADAVRKYTDVRERSTAVLARITDEPVVRMHARAIDDALYWTALCKFEQGEFDVARDSLERYRRLEKGGAWLRECRYLLAVTQASRKDYRAAIAELRQVGAADPEYAGYQARIRSWRVLRARQKEDGRGE